MYSGKEQQTEGHEDQPTGGKAIVTIKFLADKAQLKKILEASGGEGGEEPGGPGKTPPATPR